jgi:predicted nucleic acid-binding protein
MANPRSRALVDANVIVYAINTSSPKNKQAQQFLQREKERLSISHQNIFESLRVLTDPKFPSPMRTDQALNAVERIVRVLDLISPSPKTYYLTQELIIKYQISSDQIFDAYLTATALDNDVLEIATDNEKDFSLFQEIRVCNPFR